MPETKKLLLVEDEDKLAEMYAIRFEVDDFEVKIANDGEEGLNAAKEFNPDVIILDLMLPKINGFEVCRMLKFDDQYKHIPIIILSALSSQSDRDKATQAGADAYFIKPFDLDLLITKVRTLLG